MNSHTSTILTASKHPQVRKTTESERYLIPYLYSKFPQSDTYLPTNIYYFDHKS